MHQLIQKLKDGSMKVLEVPLPSLKPGSILVQNLFSMVSTGTEGRTVKAARKGYIGKAKELYQGEATFIDISKLLVNFIDEDGWDLFKEYYRDFQSTPHVVFQSNDTSIDLFDLIINEIELACKNDAIPFLIRTGCLYGTGIENVNIMEHKAVMNLKHPLVIFYPSRIEDDNLYFLNFKHASKYRCILIK